MRWQCWTRLHYYYISLTTAKHIEIWLIQNVMACEHHLTAVTQNNLIQTMKSQHVRFNSYIMKKSVSPIQITSAIFITPTSNKGTHCVPNKSRVVTWQSNSTVTKSLHENNHIPNGYKKLNDFTKLSGFMPLLEINAKQIARKSDSFTK